MNATNTLIESMNTSSKIMHKMNKNMDTEKIQKVLNNYHVESEKMNLVDEMLDDTMEELFNDEDEDVDNAVDEVMDELNLSLNSNLNDVKMNKTIEKKKNIDIESNEGEDELLKKLNLLKE
jgi:division protein CdvB (Snf7/Vps24/ESCRT-III family)